MTQLLSVASLSLAAKMEETEVPLTLDLQVKRTLQMMTFAKFVEVFGDKFC